MTMPLARMAPQLRSAVELRQWVVQHIPQTHSAVGHDLFLAIAEHLVATRPLLVRSLCADVPHPEVAVRQQLQKLQRAGLVRVEAGAGQPAAACVVPTTRFLALLNAYAEQLDRVYLVRQQLRTRQLAIDVPEPALREWVETLFDHFHDLGWLYLNTYGAICFLMARLVQQAALAHGHRARLVSGYVQVDRGNGNLFLLGGQGVSAPGQIDGHAFCVLDEAVIVDFGLGNLRKGHIPGFAWGAACAYRPQPPVFGQIALPDGCHAAWKGDWV
ncbi:MAG: hypothetical protein HY855_14995 [Burkholderiales bacterium]|nr:hypothetical protein [Burkholderiales bacterium]